MNTYRLAVCEDDDTIRESLCSLCSEILTEDDIAHKITAFPSAKELEKTMSTEENKFDLLILDIKMEGMSGMELARSLRLRDNRISIIFVSGYEEYLREGYSVQPIQFLIKPIRSDELKNALRTDRKLNHVSKNVLLRSAGKTISLPIHEVEYIESFNHSIIVHQAEKTYSCQLSLTETERLLPADQFCRCHNSYLVNLEYVEEISRTKLFLRGDVHLPIGRTYYKNFQSTFVRYINR